MKRIVQACVAGVFASAWTGSAVLAADGTLPADWNKHSGVFRGPAGNGLYPDSVAVTEWNESKGVNILWKAKVGLGWASPIVWGNQVVVTSGSSSERIVHCFDAASGKPVWKTSVPAAEGATEGHELDTQDERWNTLLHAGATPATNGKQVFAVFSNGQLTALDLATGKVLWSVVLGDTSGNNYGLDNSLLVYKDRVIAVFEGDASFVAAYSAETGTEVWKTARGGSTWASPVLVGTKSGKTLVVLPADPKVTAWDAETGKEVWAAEVLTGGPEYCVGPSPVAVGDLIAVNCQNCGIFGLDAETGAKRWGIEELPDGGGFPDGTSMATDGTLLYQYFEGMLTVVDPKAGTVLSQKELDQTASYGSPAVIGGNLYLMAGSEMVVLKTGKAPEVIGTSELKESTESSPAAAGGRLFIRTDDSLYAIGK